MKRITAISGFALIGLLVATDVDAQTTQSVAVEVTFVAVITISVPDKELQFGLLDVAMPANALITIATNGTPSGATVNIVGGTQGAAELTITAQDTVGITILVDNVAPGSFYTLENFFCSYDGGADTACDAPMIVAAVTSGVLRIGVTLRAAGGATAGNQDGTFIVTVSYQ